MDPLLETPIFALPATVALHYSEEFKKRGFVFKRRTVRTGSYELDAGIFQFGNVSDASLAFVEVLLIIGVSNGSSVIESKWGNRTVPYVVTKTGNVRIIPLSDKKEDKVKVEVSPYPLMMGCLEVFSRLSGGLDVDFYAEECYTARPTLPNKTNLINVFPWSHPPGYSVAKYIHHAFGLPIDSREGKGVLTFSGTPGRGEFVGDGENDLIQMVGNNWYLLFCVVGFSNSVSTLKILENALAIALRRYQALQGGARPANRGTRLNRQTFVGVTKEWVSSMEGNIEKVIQEMQREIENLRSNLAIKERTVFDFSQARQALIEKRSKDDLSGSLKDQWRRISSNPRVSSLSLAGDTINVITTAIDLCHDGQTYSLGKFGIGVHKNGEFYIYSLDCLHPGGVPHPHISKEGTPCFGNAGSAIRNAFRGHRYADAIGYLIIWLFDGYEENTATHKITEWPIKTALVEGGVSCEGQ